MIIENISLESIIWLSVAFGCVIGFFIGWILGMIFHYLMTKNNLEDKTKEEKEK